MATRKIKDAKDLSTNELIYFKGHAKATYMSDGRNVEDAIHQIGTGGGGGGITAETDPIFSASPAATITDEKITEWNGKQDKLVSGTNIKTINGNSILGSGDIVISGGSGAYSEVNHGTADTTFTLTPNVFHVWDEVDSLTLTLGDETASVANEFLFQFNSGSTATTLTLPDTIKWANDSAPTIEANKIYQISILKGLASMLSWENVSLFPAILYVGHTLPTHIDIFAYLDAKYGKVDSEISEDIQLRHLSGRLEEVTSISYGSYGGYSGFWLNGYGGLPGATYCVLMQNGEVTSYTEMSGGGA